MSDHGEDATLEQITREFVAYYAKGGGCSNCGGLPHSSSCFAGRFDAALARRSPPPPVPMQQRSPAEQAAYANARRVVGNCGDDDEAAPLPLAGAQETHDPELGAYLADALTPRPVDEPCEADVSPLAGAQEQIAALHDLVSSYDAITDPEAYPDLHARAVALLDPCHNPPCRHRVAALLLVLFAAAAALIGVS